VLTTDFADCVSPAILWRPARTIDPDAWIEHIPFAFWLIGALRPRSVVELGTLGGNSFFAFCQAAAAHGVQSRLTAIDTWQGDEHAGHYSEDVFADVSRYRDANYPESAHLMRALFDEARPNFATASIDLLHIDGLHTYDAVRHDFETWSDALSSRGVVLFHDIAVRERGFGVWQLWEELSARYPAFAFTHGHGLGVLGVGSEMPTALQQLFHLPEGAAETLRSLYHRLGQSVVDREAELRRLRRRLFQIETSRSWKFAGMLADAANVLRRAGGRAKS
jgi:O-antigen biosynthesis protein